MSLLHNLPYKEYKKALTLPVQECQRIARLADIQISFNNDKPGEQLVKALDRAGCSYERYAKLINSLDTIPTFYRPQAKVAIMIANERYTHLANLATPVCDCELLGSILSSLDFIVVIIKNSTSSQLKDALRNVFEMIPEDSYCFIFYAGHGCQLSNTQCMLGVDCPTEDIELQHCNLLISYSAQSSQSAYEVLQIECTTSMELENDVTYELKTSDLDRIVPGSSQYAHVLGERLAEIIGSDGSIYFAMVRRIKSIRRPSRAVARSIGRVEA
ncbi:Mucosa associated lymphoid tissue lymphoma translocation protein 1, isoform b [Operophtera brumata]|uniref:Mucosa associated lymphoid tissue lymphoma translocation protein 1, isoform b n=1 Tax=Operophtera brumata TaxID=104452 RepID=A0A0L7LHN8_OPEBR|nr:Mucosa associated lymphoid tissue lymphoma translocation protein 1, isoform b [Operophtera brumata]